MTRSQEIVRLFTEGNSVDSIAWHEMDRKKAVYEETFHQTKEEVESAIRSALIRKPAVERFKARQKGRKSK